MSFNFKLFKHEFRSWKEKRAWIEKYSLVRRKRVWKLSEQQNHRCCYCGCLTWIHDGTGEFDYPFEIDRLRGMTNNQQATADHYTPLSKGGKDTLANMIMACVRCNKNRSNSPAEAFWEAVQGGRKGMSVFIKEIYPKKYTPEEIAERRHQKNKKTAFLLGFLFIASPVAKMIGDAIMDEIEAKLGVGIES